MVFNSDYLPFILLINIIFCKRSFCKLLTHDQQNEKFGVERTKNQKTTSQLKKLTEKFLKRSLAGGLPFDLFRQEQSRAFTFDSPLGLCLGFDFLPPGVSVVTGNW